MDIKIVVHNIATHKTLPNPDLNYKQFTNRLIDEIRNGYANFKVECSNHTTQYRTVARLFRDLSTKMPFISVNLQFEKSAAPIKTTRELFVLAAISKYLIDAKPGIPLSLVKFLYYYFVPNAKPFKETLSLMRNIKEDYNLTASELLWLILYYRNTYEKENEDWAIIERLLQLTKIPIEDLLRTFPILSMYAKNIRKEKDIALHTKIEKDLIKTTLNKLHTRNIVYSHGAIALPKFKQ